MQEKVNKKKKVSPKKFSKGPSKRKLTWRVFYEESQLCGFEFFEHRLLKRLCVISMVFPQDFDHFINIYYLNNNHCCPVFNKL